MKSTLTNLTPHVTPTHRICWTCGVRKIAESMTPKAHKSGLTVFYCARCKG